MPGTTTNLGLQYALGADGVSGFPATSAQALQLIDGYSLLTSVVTNTTSATVARGQTVIASPSTTQTLPAATANAMVAIVASSTVTGAAPVTISGSNIYGVGLANPATSLTLGTPGGTVVLQSDGSKWYVIAGQQDSGWVTWTQPTNWTASATNPPGVRVVGNMAYMRGQTTNNTGSTQTLYSTGLVLPAAAQPAFQRIGMGGGNTVSPCGFNVTATGQLQINALSGSIPNGGNLNFDGISYSIS
jgi:hypothetical protein